ncbi:hypothetical protein FACS189475_04190 [Betaproteobacteria bacterium]|nr:hypothetical protein FACS189475_04190 [Betaproteobacteria bacterium]
MQKKLIALAVSALFTGHNTAIAAPDGGKLVAGQAAIQQNGAATTIDQTSQRAIINWNTFDIGQKERVLHNMPDPNSAALHRVTGGKGASQLAGELKSNGNIFLVNPAGVTIHKGAKIDVGGFVASTADIDNKDFMQGNYAFTKPGHPDAKILNLGSINVRDTGFAALVAPTVRNDGIIAARLGKIVLASGEGYKLDVYGDDLINFTTAEEVVNTLYTQDGTQLGVENTGQIKAEGGVVLLTASQLDKVVKSVINNGGTVSAASAEIEGGKIVFRGEGDVDVKVSGTLDASGQTGGKVTINGERITLKNAQIDARGTNGGGTILIGDSQTPETRIGSNVALDASTENGDGGFIETSGRTLEIADTVKVDASSKTGQGGEWLLDPYDLTVDAVAANTVSTTLDNGTHVTLQTTASGASGPGTQKADGKGDININAAINWNKGSVLTLDAYRSVEVNAPITATGANAGLVVKYDQGGSGSIDANFYANAPVDLPAGGSLNINGQGFTLIDRLAEITDLNASGRYALRKDINSDISAPIGGLGTFFGTLEGLGHAINGLTIDLSTTYFVGLFDSIGTGGLVRNLGVVDGSVKGDTYAGMLAGYNEGTIINSYATGAVSSTGNHVGGLVGSNDGTVSRSYATGEVSSGGGSVGGLVGENSGTVSQSYATGVVSGNFDVGGLVGGNHDGTVSQSYATGAVSGYSAVGGLVGGNWGSSTVSRSYATGEVSSGGGSVGGLVGYNSGTVSQSYATGAVSGTGNYVGGLVGSNDGSTVSSYATGKVSGEGQVGGLVGSNNGAVSQSYATGAVSGTGYYVGGLVGNIINGTVSQSYATGAVSGVSYVGGLVGNNIGGTVSTSYWDTDTTGQTTSSGGTGLSHADMLLAASFVGFDTQYWKLQDGQLPQLIFDPNVWVLKNGQPPKLAWQPPSTPPVDLSQFTPEEVEWLLYYNMFINRGALKVEGFIADSAGARNAFAQYVADYAKRDYQGMVTGQYDTASLSSLLPYNVKALNQFVSTFRAALASHYGAYSPALNQPGLDALVKNLYELAFVRASGNTGFTYTPGEEAKLEQAYQTALDNVKQVGAQYKQYQEILNKILTLNPGYQCATCADAFEAMDSNRATVQADYDSLKTSMTGMVQAWKPGFTASTDATLKSEYDSALDNIRNFVRDYGPDFSVIPVSNDPAQLKTDFGTVAGRMKTFISQYGVTVPANPAQLAAAYAQAKQKKSEQDQQNQNEAELLAKIRILSPGYSGSVTESIYNSFKTNLTNVYQQYVRAKTGASDYIYPFSTDATLRADFVNALHEMETVLQKPVGSTPDSGAAQLLQDYIDYKNNKNPDPGDPGMPPAERASKILIVNAFNLTNYGDKNLISDANLNSLYNNAVSAMTARIREAFGSNAKYPNPILQAQAFINRYLEAMDKLYPVNGDPDRDINKDPGKGEEDECTVNCDDGGEPPTPPQPPKSPCPGVCTPALQGLWDAFVKAWGEDAAKLPFDMITSIVTDAFKSELLYSLGPSLSQRELQELLNSTFSGITRQMFNNPSSWAQGFVLTGLVDFAIDLTKDTLLKAFHLENPTTTKAISLEFTLNQTFAVIKAKANATIAAAIAAPGGPAAAWAAGVLAGKITLLWEEASIMTTQFSRIYDTLQNQLPEVLAARQC